MRPPTQRNRCAGRHLVEGGSDSLFSFARFAVAPRLFQRRHARCGDEAHDFHGCRNRIPGSAVIFFRGSCPMAAAFCTSPPAPPALPPGFSSDRWTAASPSRSFRLEPHFRSHMRRRAISCSRARASSRRLSTPGTGHLSGEVIRLSETPGVFHRMCRSRSRAGFWSSARSVAHSLRPSSPGSTVRAKSSAESARIGPIGIRRSRRTGNESRAKSTKRPDSVICGSSTSIGTSNRVSRSSRPRGRASSGRPTEAASSSPRIKTEASTSSSRSVPTARARRSAC